MKRRALGACLRGLVGAAIVVAMLPTAQAYAAQGQPQVSSGDTAWLLTSSALVLMMTIPGLALFYGGMVRRKNVLSVMMQSMVLAAVISIQWVIVGYSLAFSPGSVIIGSLHWIGLSGVSASRPYPAYSATVPHQAYMVFQCMFAVITPAVIIGALAERISFRGFLLFSLLWTTLIYDPLTHWVWGAGGWLHAMGTLDFAGGTIVEISSGATALAGALMLGKRRGYPREQMPPHNLVYSGAGAGLLWVGWFGFNAGSALAANGLAVSSFVATQLGAAGGVVGWMITEWAVTGKPTVLGVASGAVAGLVAITAAAGFVGPMAAIIIGLAGGAVCFGAVRLKPLFGYDDTLDVVGVHGVGGILGMLGTGIFASVLINPAGANGLLYGHPGQLLIQSFASVVAVAFTFIGSIIVFKVTDMLVGIRVAEEDEVLGLDLSQHNETAYAVEA